MYTKINECRICGNPDLISILDLGEQTLTGTFPKKKEQKITSGPLELVKCHEDQDGRCCGLVQLRHSYSLDEMYGENYGYRSGLNQSMVEHLQNKVRKILKLVDLKPNDLVLDIGSNDSTLLQAYPKSNYALVGIDPTGKKFMDYYPDHIQLIPDFFSAAAVKKNFGDRKAKVITSIAMFYDLEKPLNFMKEIFEVLSDDGIWVFEQSYMPTMLEMNSYDTACHEHLEYYRLKQIKWMTDKVGLKIIDIEFNEINGGSFSVTVAKANSIYRENGGMINSILLQEEQKGLGLKTPYAEFNLRVFRHREKLVRFIKRINEGGQKIFGYGASTKGNVLLQFCGLTEKDLPFIAEVNKDKFGCYTPGTLIPIVSEEEIIKLKPDYFLVLPWHFKKNIIQREKKYLSEGGKLVMPLPSIEVVTG